MKSIADVLTLVENYLLNVDKRLSTVSCSVLLRLPKYRIINAGAFGIKKIINAIPPWHSRFVYGTRRQDRT